MFFPIGDANIKQGHKPAFTWALIVLNIGIFIFQFLMPPTEQEMFVYTYGSIPVEVMHFRDLYTLLTCIFLHGGWMHLAGNMLFLWVFADNIEATIGHAKFILFYLAGGLVASLVHTFMNPLSEVPCVGASGAIAACLGAYLVMFPHSRIRIFFVFFLTTFSVSALYFLGFWILQQFMAGYGQLNAVTDNVAYWAHIGGFLFGVVMGFIYREQAKKMELH